MGQAQRKKRSKEQRRQKPIRPATAEPAAAKPASATVIKLPVADRIPQFQRAANTRPCIDGITIDSANTRLRDQGFNIIPTSKGWILQVSIVDMYGILPANSALERKARETRFARKVEGDEEGKTFIENIFPHDYLLKQVSFMPRKSRPAITFTVHLDHKLNVRQYDVDRTIFTSRAAYSFEEFTDRTFSADGEWESKWSDLGWSLFIRRMKDATINSRNLMGMRSNTLDLSEIDDSRSGGERLVGEIMLLTNRIAAKYLVENNLPAPFVPPRGSITPVRVTPNLSFDRGMNHLAVKLYDQLAGETRSHIRVTSPMRSYPELLALKAIIRHHDGLPVEQEIINEAKALSAEFARHAGYVNPILKESWKKKWGAALYDPPEKYRVLPDHFNSSLSNLFFICSKCGFPKPELSERRIRVAGTTMHLVGINLPEVNYKGLTLSPMQGWGVSADWESSTEMAADQLRTNIGTRFPALAGAKIPNGPFR